MPHTIEMMSMNHTRTIAATSPDTSQRVLGIAAIASDWDLLDQPGQSGEQFDRLTIPRYATSPAGTGAVYGPAPEPRVAPSMQGRVSLA